MKKLLTATAVLAFAFATPALAIEVPATTTTASTESATKGPAIWKLSDEDTTIYMLGTFHLLPADYQWRNDTINSAMAVSDELVVETIVDRENPMEMMMAIQQLGISPGLPPILDRVDAENRGNLEAAIEKSGLPGMAFDMMETWTAGLMLIGVQFQELGLSGDAGVELDVEEAFKAAGKPIGQLETNAEQLGYFDGLSEETQREFLVSVIEPANELQVEFDAMLAAWSVGDMAAIAQSFNEDFTGNDEAAEALLYQRNALWAAWIHDRMEQPGTVFLAVGAGHLAGDRSVIDLLEKGGKEVTRIQ